MDEGYHHGGFGDNENGLERLYHSMTGNHYRQGPYLSFLQINTEAAISLVCEIANFASVRQAESIDRIGSGSVLARVRSPVNQSAVWLGDEHSFQLESWAVDFLRLARACSNRCRKIHW